MLNKRDIQITLEDEKCFRIHIRKRFLVFFTKWVKLMYREAENTEEIPVEFTTLQEAKDFINKIAV